MRFLELSGVSCKISGLFSHLYLKFCFVTKPFFQKFASSEKICPKQDHLFNILGPNLRNPFAICDCKTLALESIILCTDVISIGYSKFAMLIFETLPIAVSLWNRQVRLVDLYSSDIPFLDDYCKKNWLSTFDVAICNLLRVWLIATKFSGEQKMRWTPTSELELW